MRHSEERLRLVLDTTPALIHGTRPDGYLDFFNQYWLDYVGSSLDDLAGWKWTASIHPEDLPALLEKRHALIAAGEPFELQARVRRADGVYRWILTHMAPLRDEQGNIVKWYGTGSDIDDLKRAEDRIRLIIDTIPTMAWSVRPDGVVDFSNQRWMDYCGLSVEQYIEEPTRPIHPEDIPRVMEKWRADMAAGEPYEDEMRLRRADGEYRWFLVRTAPLRDERGNIVKCYGSSIDIEDRKRAEEALRLSEKRYRLIVENQTEFIVEWLRDGTRTFANENYCRTFGIAEADCIGTSFFPLVAPEFLEGIQRNLAALTPDQPEFTEEHLSFLPDGRHWQQWRSRGIFDAAGNLIKLVSTGRDITELKRAEEELQRSRDQFRSLAARLRTVLEEERTRLARELHDELGSELTGLKWDLETLARTLSAAVDESQLETLRKELETIVKRMDIIFNTVRRIASDLRPRMLDDLGLLEAVEWQAQQFQARSGITCHCRFCRGNISVEPGAIDGRLPYLSGSSDQYPPSCASNEG